MSLYWHLTLFFAISAVLPELLLTTFSFQVGDRAWKYKTTFKLEQTALKLKFPDDFRRENTNGLQMFIFWRTQSCI